MATLKSDVVEINLMEIKIPNTKETVRVERAGQFPFKQTVTDLLTNTICDSIVSAKNYTEKTEYTTYCFGELQMHSLIIPALAKNTDCFIFEYPIERRVGRKNHFGRVDYYCRCNVGKRNEYHLFIELKSNKQSLPFDRFREDSIRFWETAYKQICGIGQEIKANRAFYTKPIIRVCIETVFLYAHKTKNITTADIDAATEIAQNDFVINNANPNLIVLWKCSDEIRAKAKDEWSDDRKIYGIIFKCHIMEPIIPKKE